MCGPRREPAAPSEEGVRKRIEWVGLVVASIWAASIWRLAHLDNNALGGGVGRGGVGVGVGIRIRIGGNNVEHLDAS